MFMVLRLRPLVGPYAIAAGDAILKRAAEFSRLPEEILGDFGKWRDAHHALADLVHPAGPDARIVDPFLDRAVLLPARICQQIIDAYTDAPVPLTEAQQQRIAAARLLLPVFGSDLRLVNLPFVEEWVAVRDVIQRLGTQADLVAALALLGLGPDLELIKSLHAVYGEALGIGAQEAATPDQDIRIASWNATFQELMVAAQFLDRKAAGLITLFAAPYQEQLGRQQEVAARLRAKGVVKADSLAPHRTE
jgi:hypothetical protein